MLRVTKSMYYVAYPFVVTNSRIPFFHSFIILSFIFYFYFYNLFIYLYLFLLLT